MGFLQRDGNGIPRLQERLRLRGYVRLGGIRRDVIRPARTDCVLYGCVLAGHPVL